MPLPCSLRPPGGCWWGHRPWFRLVCSGLAMGGRGADCAPRRRRLSNDRHCRRCSASTLAGRASTWLERRHCIGQRFCRRLLSPPVRMSEVEEPSARRLQYVGCDTLQILHQPHDFVGIYHHGLILVSLVLPSAPALLLEEVLIWSEHHSINSQPIAPPTALG